MMLADLTGRAAESATRILLVRRTGRQPVLTQRRWILLGWGGRARAGSWCADSDLAAAVAALDGDPSGACDLDPVIAVCAHGVHDACCAIRGRPVAAALAQRWPDQVYECSHLGGDRFAPNVAILPDGFYYGNLDPNNAVETVGRHLAGEVPARFLRGMSRFAPPVQAAAAVVFDRYGPLAADDLTVRSVHQIGPHHGHGSKTFAELELHDGRRLALEVESVRRPEAQLTCRAGRATPATGFQVVSCVVMTAAP